MLGGRKMSMDHCDNVEELNRLKKTINEKKQSRDRIEGQLSELYRRLKEELGYDSPDQAKEELFQKREKLKEHKETLSRKLEELKEQYQW
jgi:chromosome segregation ATPase